MVPRVVCLGTYPPPVRDRHFPTRASLIRLVGVVLAEQDDEWQDGRRHLRPETMPLIDAAIDHEGVTPLLMAS